MKLEHAVRLVVSRCDALAATGLYREDEELEALLTMTLALSKARMAAMETLCICNSARRFEDVAKDVFELLEVPSSPPLRVVTTCPFHSQG